MSNACRWLSIFAALGLILPPRTSVALEPVGAPERLDSLQRKITTIITQPRYHSALWGVKIASLDSRTTIFECNADRLFSPASNAKLFSMALALDKLGPDYCIRTSVYALEKPNSHGVIKGDLVIFGRGDPAFNTKFHGGDLNVAFEPLINGLVNAGVKRITGDIIGDESYFRGSPYGTGWAWDDLQESFGAEVSALSVNDNVIQFLVKGAKQVGDPGMAFLEPAGSYVTVSNFSRTISKDTPAGLTLTRPLGANVIYVTGSVPAEDPGSAEGVAVHDPAGWFAYLFKEALMRHGIKVEGKARSMSWIDRQVEPFDSTKYVELSAVQSPPLHDLLRETQKTSQNLYADLLFNIVGVVAPMEMPGIGDTTEETAAKTLKAFLKQAGVPAGEAFLSEGSGLSHRDLVSPNAVVALLDFMARHRYADVYVNALPIAGVDGTLRGRLRQTPAAGNLHGKTGTLEWANSLSGYVTTAAGEHLVFSLLLNRYRNTDPDHPRTADLDAIAAALASFTGRTAR